MQFRIFGAKCLFFEAIFEALTLTLSKMNFFNSCVQLIELRRFQQMYACEKILEKITFHWNILILLEFLF